MVIHQPASIKNEIYYFKRKHVKLVIISSQKILTSLRTGHGGGACVCVILLSLDVGLVLVA